MAWLMVPIATAVVAAPAPAQIRRSLVLSQPLPGLVRVGDLVIVRGRVTGVPAGTAVRLQLRLPGSGAWQVLARTRTRRSGRFTLRWRVPKRPSALASVRVGAYKDQRLLLAGKPADLAIGPAFVPCAPPQIPKVLLPMGYGLVYGGPYIEGGPFPGVDACNTQPYRVTATSSDGTKTVGLNVAGGHSYWLSLPAGTYTLAASSCGTAMATVTAGQLTRADLICAAR
jgi:hypothetical protein